MRYALPGSVLVHAGILGIALYGFAWPEAEDAPAEIGRASCRERVCMSV